LIKAARLEKIKVLFFLKMLLLNIGLSTLFSNLKKTPNPMIPIRIKIAPLIMGKRETIHEEYQSQLVDYPSGIVNFLTLAFAPLTFNLPEQ
jgi:hypothetical protein